MTLRPFPLDSALLLFDRESGRNVLLDGDETSGLQQVAPRVVQFGITNACNLACAFCSRDVTSESTWTADEAFTMLADLARAGVLEVAFGGGEPFAFRGFDELVSRLHAETPLAVHATTNGLLLTRQRIHALRGRIGELRVSLYEDNDWRRTVSLLATEGQRFGINLLVLPERLPMLETLVLEVVALGCRDVLLLSYNGGDRSRHLSAEQSRDLAGRVATLHRAIGRRARVALDVCWGERMAPLPRFFERRDCGAGRDFVVLTSDRSMMACSFHHASVPIRTANDVIRHWRSRSSEFAAASSIPGCARAADFGLETES